MITFIIVIIIITIIIIIPPTSTKLKSVYCTGGERTRSRWRRNRSSLRLITGKLTDTAHLLETHTSWGHCRWYGEHWGGVSSRDEQSFSRNSNLKSCVVTRVMHISVFPVSRVTVFPVEGDATVDEGHVCLIGQTVIISPFHFCYSSLFWPCSILPDIKHNKPNQLLGNVDIKDGIVTLTALLCSSVYTLRILIVLISINSTHIHVHWGLGLAVWRLCRRLWRRGLYLWQPAVPPVDVGSSHWQHLSVLVLIPYEYLSSLFRLMLLRNNVHWGRGCRYDDLSSLVAPRVVFVTACGATGRCGVVTLTAPPCSNACIPQIYMLSFRQVHTYWYVSLLAPRPNGQHF